VFSLCNRVDQVSDVENDDDDSDAGDSEIIEQLQAEKDRDMKKLVFSLICWKLIN